MLDFNVHWGCIFQQREEQDRITRRLAFLDQAFFERINVYEIENIDTVEGEPGESFDSLLDPKLHAAALAYEASVRAGGGC
ncbi:hypothetical protein [Microbacterium sp. A93]|uniref:hypothetical protein n=1 Tax=Microbacterium sp. A93 TaxID=3450716 RepID=UPI003F4359DB